MKPRAVLLPLLLASALQAQPLLHDPSLSPDGRELAFVSGGDMHPRGVDVPVTRAFGEDAAGKDSQLDAAVRELMK